MMNFLEVMKTMEVTTKSTDGTGVCSVKKEDDECMVRTIKCLGFLFEAHHTIVFD